MSNVVVVRSRAFPGWDPVRRDLIAVGPFRVLAHLQERAQSELRNGGAFGGDESHTPINHAILTRILLRLIVDAPNSITAEVAALSSTERAQVETILEQMTGLVNGASNQDRVEGLARGSNDLTRQIARWNWRTHLGLAGRSRVAKCEIARTWLLLRDYWPRSRGRAAGNVIPQLVDPLVSAFDSLEHLLALYLSLFNTDRALVIEPSRYFVATQFGPLLAEVFELYVPEAADVVGTWADIEAQAAFPHRNPFRREALLRIGQQLLVAPDPGILFSGAESRMISRAVRAASARECLPEHSLLEGANTLLGYIYEDYLRDLLEEVAAETRESYFPEFRTTEGGLSPDAALRKNKNVLLFECKARGLPTVDEQPASLEPFLEMLRVLAGERSNRSPFAQLSNFFSTWRARDAEAVSRLGRFAAGPRRCVIVCPDNLPNVVHWRLFRDQVVAHDLGPPEREAERLVEFASIYDVEVLCSAAQMLNRRQAAVTCFDLIERWRNSNRKTNGFDLEGSVDRLKWSLGDYLLVKHPDVNALLLPRTQDALQKAFAAATTTLFPTR